jgi:hypothetical protein
MNIDLSEEHPDARAHPRILLDTRDATTPLRSPAAALAVLMLLSARQVNGLYGGLLDDIA